MSTAPEVKTAFGDALAESKLAGDIAWLRSNESFVDAAGNVNLPYSKTAANFNDVRELAATVKTVADDISWLRGNESFIDANGVVTQPFSKTAANFNDVREGFVAVNAKLDALAAAVTALAAVVAAK